MTLCQCIFSLASQLPTLVTALAVWASTTTFEFFLSVKTNVLEQFHASTKPC